MQLGNYIKYESWYFDSQRGIVMLDVKINWPNLLRATEYYPRATFHPDENMIRCFNEEGGEVKRYSLDVKLSEVRWCKPEPQEVLMDLGNEEFEYSVPDIGGEG